MSDHRLHRIIGQSIGQPRGYHRVLLDDACQSPRDEDEERHSLSLRMNWGREVELCRPDIIATTLGMENQEEEVSVIIEIEQGGMGPHKMQGKLFTSALAEYLVKPQCREEERKVIPLSKNALFIQIIEHKMVEDDRTQDWDEIRRVVNEDFGYGQYILKYELLWGEENDFKLGGGALNKLLNLLSAHLVDPERQ